ncbi:MAG: acyltransferase family protein [Acetobacter sp.]|nr:acyltransferase family protein [Acetobacter sp.]
MKKTLSLLSSLNDVPHASMSSLNDTPLASMSSLNDVPHASMSSLNDVPHASMSSLNDTPHASVSSLGLRSKPSRDLPNPQAKQIPLPPLSGVKLLAVIGILCCHTGLIHAFDACARMVEILFLLSGFLMAYNHFFTTTEHTLLNGWHNVKKKLPKFYPIHIFTFLLQALFVSYWAEKPLSYLFSVGTLNLTLLHAWFIETEFSYNNVSWFLSALMFAYLLTPTLAGIIKHLGTTLSALIKFAVFIILFRALFEYLTLNGYIRIDLHCNPMIQTLNYALGYTAGVLFQQKSQFNQYIKEKTSPLFLTILQLLCITLYILCCIRFRDTLRLFFVLIPLPMLYLLAIPRGLIAKLLSYAPIQKLSTLTLEIFMLHSFILYKFPTNAGDTKSYIIFFTLTLISALAFHQAQTLWQKYIR